MQQDHHLSRSLLYSGNGVTVVGLSRHGPAECDVWSARPPQMVEYATVMVTRAGRASLVHAARPAWRVVAEPGRPIVLHPGDAYRVHYPAPTPFRATIVVLPRGSATPAHAAPNLGRRDVAHRELAERACALLAADPGSAHRLRDVACALGVSPFHLARIFHAQIGASLHQYLLRIRLGLALEQLVSGERNLSTLAVSLGFATHSHFSAAFRRSFGTSPRAVRALLSGADTSRAAT